ncbi:MAG TPA: TMEM165/GDT1 family protein, partial [Rudaea sp.]|nr:TMEM165/GDT1 family protein [Rudaea sp.]
MQPFLISAASVALAEFGDKTQLLALVLAAKYRRPWLIALGILLATLANHALAGAFGALVAHWFAPQTLRWLVAASFFA